MCLKLSHCIFLAPSKSQYLLASSLVYTYKELQNMSGGFGMKKDLRPVSNPQECSVCNRIFLTPQDLISHSNTFHSNPRFSTFSSSAATAPATFRPYPDINHNLNPTLPVMNRFDLNYYRSGYIDQQGRFQIGYSATTPANISNFPLGQQEKPKLMNLFPEMPSESVRTLPLLCQLEKRRPQDTGTKKSGDISSSIDLTLRL